MGKIKEEKNTEHEILLKAANAEISRTILLLTSQTESLKKQLQLGIIDSDGVRCELDMITKKEKAERQKLVFMNHVTADGRLRSISHHAPTDSNPKDYYVTKMPDGSKITATTYDGLIEKLFERYTNGLTDYTLESVFKAALYEKKITENPKTKTILRNQMDFKRYFSDDLKSKNIRTITDITLKQYTQEWVNREHPKAKSFLAYKGILNLIFGYAFRQGIISSNPVKQLNNKPYMKSCDTRKAKPEEKILSPAEIDILRNEVRHRMTKDKWGSYYINGYAMLFAIETGVRAGELCALKWEDIHETYIHIHAQQLTQKENGEKVYYYDPHTKNEKGISADGRKFPLTKKIRELLDELKNKQNELGIKSEYIFCHENGDWIKEEAYMTFLRRLCQSHGFKVTNNHALRMSLNSNVLIPLGISVADRAAMLGHSIQTNLQNYSFAQRDSLEKARILLDSQHEDNLVTPRKPLNVIPFPQKRNSESPIYQAF